MKKCFDCVFLIGREKHKKWEQSFHQFSDGSYASMYSSVDFPEPECYCTHPKSERFNFATSSVEESCELIQAHASYLKIIIFKAISFIRMAFSNIGDRLRRIRDFGFFYKEE